MIFRSARRPSRRRSQTGEHVFEIRKKGFKSWSKKVTIEEGETIPLGIKLQREKEKQERVKRASPRPPDRDRSAGRPTTPKRQVQVDRL